MPSRATSSASVDLPADRTLVQTRAAIPGRAGRGLRVRPAAHAAGYSNREPTPKVPSVKVCPHCAEELPDEATVCSKCNKDPALAPPWNVPGRLGDVFGPDGVLPTSDNVPAPFKHLEPSGALGIPPKVWMSLILAFVWGFAWAMIAGLTSPALPWETRLILQAVGYIAGLILGIWGRAEVGPSDRTGQILGNIAIALNALRLAWTVIWAIEYGLVVRG